MQKSNIAKICVFQNRTKVKFGKKGEKAQERGEESITNTEKGHYNEPSKH